MARHPASAPTRPPTPGKAEAKVEAKADDEGKPPLRLEDLLSPRLWRARADAIAFSQRPSQIGFYCCPPAAAAHRRPRQCPVHGPEFRTVPFQRLMQDIAAHHGLAVVLHDVTWIESSISNAGVT